MDNKLVTSAITQFRTLFAAGMERLTEACEVYAEAVDRGGLVARRAFEDAFHGKIDTRTWNRFYLVGKGRLHRELLWASGAWWHATRFLPLSVQGDLVENGVELLLENGDVLRVRNEDMSQAQRLQAFAGDHIRSLAEQRAFLADQTARRPAATRPAEAYRITQNRLIIYQPLTLERRDVARILAEMER